MCPDERGLPPAEEVSAGPEATGDEPNVDEMASAALARARQAARAKGLRPGSRAARGQGGRVSRAGGTTVGPGATGPGAAGRDPALLGEQVEELLAERGWHTDVSAGAVIGRWAQIVGPDVAEHATPTSFTDGVLTVRAGSSAWATQLGFLRSQLLGRIADEVGPGVVDELRIVGPGAPSWSRGKRRAPGSRGPRDTYG